MLVVVPWAPSRCVGSTAYQPAVGGKIIAVAVDAATPAEVAVEVPGGDAASMQRRSPGRLLGDPSLPSRRRKKLAGNDKNGGSDDRREAQEPPCRVNVDDLEDKQPAERDATGGGGPDRLEGATPGVSRQNKGRLRPWRRARRAACPPGRRR